MPTYAALPLVSPKQKQGQTFEHAALLFLQQQGLILVAQNWLQAGIGELDLVMLEPGNTWSTLVFIEVRQRQTSRFGDALASVTPAKRRKITKAARYFLQAYPQYKEHDCRFDVVAFDVDPGGHTQPQWVQGAFYASA